MTLSCHKYLLIFNTSSFCYDNGKEKKDPQIRRSMLPKLTFGTLSHKSRKKSNFPNSFQFESEIDKYHSLMVNWKMRMLQGKYFNLLTFHVFLQKCEIKSTFKCSSNCCFSFDPNNALVLWNSDLILYICSICIVSRLLFFVHGV